MNHFFTTVVLMNHPDRNLLLLLFLATNIHGYGKMATAWQARLMGSRRNIYLVSTVRLRINRYTEVVDATFWHGVKSELLICIV